jgi:hypothetical protein
VPSSSTDRYDAQTAGTSPTFVRWSDVSMRSDLQCRKRSWPWGFSVSVIPLAEDTDFDDLLRELDAVELADHGNGLVIRSKLAPKR